MVRTYLYHISTCDVPTDISCIHSEYIYIYTKVWVHFTRLPHATDPLFAEPVPSVNRLLVGILKASHFSASLGSRKKSLNRLLVGILKASHFSASLGSRKKSLSTHPIPGGVKGTGGGKPKTHHATHQRVCSPGFGEYIH